MINILFISIWGIEDGISRATVVPHVEELRSFKHVGKVKLFTIERDYYRSTDPNHIVYKSGHLVIDKIIEVLRIPQILIKICNENDIDLIIARSTPAGNFALKANRRTGIPFVVESFEPHAEYMFNNKIWRKWGFKYQYYKLKEKKLKSQAEYLITVSEHYRIRLIEEGLEQKVMLAPCSVKVDVFKYNEVSRSKVRHKLKIQDRLVGVYVGKFGDIYWSLSKATDLFRRFLKELGDSFFLLIITNHNNYEIEQNLKMAGFGSRNLFVTSTHHSNIPKFLCASDFAFTLVNSTLSSKFCSPIKNGEYWACGLPTIIPEDIGDDSHIINKEIAGFVIDSEGHNLSEGIQNIKKIVRQKDHRKRISDLAGKYKSMDFIRSNYETLLAQLFNSIQ